MTYTFSLGWNTGMTNNLSNGPSPLFSVSDSSELFTGWFGSDRQTTLRAIRVPQSPSGLGALVGLRHQLPVRRHVCLRGPTHVHSSTVFGYAVVPSPGILWYSLKYLITDAMNFVRATGLPWEAEGRWRWRGLAASYTRYFPFLPSLYRFRSMEMPATTVGDWWRRNSL